VDGATDFVKHASWADLDPLRKGRLCVLAVGRGGVSQPVGLKLPLGSFVGGGKFRDQRLILVVGSGV